MSLPFPAAVIQAVLNAGVQEFVVCAGARNSALIVVLAALGDKVRLWQHFDERAAGFFAIGRIRATECPVAVVTTSGTAAAALLPAMIEAHYQGLPLIALTADRPKHYRGSGAPQAIEQAGLFTTYADMSDVCTTADLATEIRQWETKWRGLNPLHINVCLEEPASDALSSLRVAGTEIKASLLQSIAVILEVQRFVRAFRSDCPAIEPDPALAANRVLLFGDMPPTKSLMDIFQAAAGQGIVYAEAASGLRDESILWPRMLRCGDASLRHLPLDEVWRFGCVPSLRFWRDLEHIVHVKVQSVSVNIHTGQAMGYGGLAREKATVTLRVEGGLPPLESPAPATDCLARDAALYTRLGELLTKFPNSEPAIFRRLSQVIPQGATVFTGNSLSIREWNLCAEYGRGHRVHVLRGANGIDGNLSAFLGVAADAQEAWCVTGDLTTLYDLNAPWMLRQLSPGRRRFVVIQNAGGKIFSRLPSLRGLTDRERALMENPHTISLHGWAEMWGMDHASGGPEVLESAGSLTDHAVIELRPDSAETEAFWNAWAKAEQEAWA
jgi:2-succinyl-5-enolpyruvyl-6-hydroxy-3-cyclohexene-1-carboxylate synthase